MFEQKTETLLTRTAFFMRLGRSFGITLLIVVFSLGFGSAGYHYYEGIPWVDSLLNASMILTGMGPVDTMHSVGGKLFATFYALYSGIAFLTMMAIMLAPMIHRWLHRFHLEDDDDSATIATPPSGHPGS
jgi:hypothetical protein